MSVTEGMDTTFGGSTRTKKGMFRTVSQLYKVMCFDVYSAFIPKIIFCLKKLIPIFFIEMKFIIVFFTWSFTDIYNVCWIFWYVK